VPPPGVTLAQTPRGSDECPRQDSNLYAISGTGPSNQPVYQFQHVGMRERVLGEGLEPSQDYSYRILNPARLPFPPSELALASTEVRSASGAEGNRTPDLLNAIQALSQLSYSPGSARPRSPDGLDTTRIVKKHCVTGLTGLEPAASGVTDRHSNRLSYSPPSMSAPYQIPNQSGRPDSNRRPSAWQADALPTELRPRPALSGDPAPCSELRSSWCPASAPTGNRTPVSTLKEWRPDR
jgi:hypothetical protein